MLNNYTKNIMQYLKKENLNLQLNKSNNENLVDLEKYLINESRFYPASNKEWITSIYAYNKASIKSLPVKDKLLYILLNSYFNLKQNKVKGVSGNAFLNIKNSSLSSFAKKKIKSKKFSLLLVKASNLKNLYLLKQWKKNLNLANKQLLSVSKPISQQENLLSLEKINKNSKRYLLIIKQRLLKKIRIQEKKKNSFLKKTYLSIPEIKHLNNKSIITVSIYNRNNQILKKKIYKLYKMFILKKQQEITLLNHIKSFKKIKYESKLFSQNKAKSLEEKKSVNNSFKAGQKLSLYKKIYTYFKIKSEKSLLINKSILFSSLAYDVKKINLRKLKKIKKIIQKKYKKLLKYKYLIMLLCFYKFRLNNSNLLGLKNITRKIYGKKIVFRIINLKYMYLDSNIMAEAITKKLRDRKKKIIRVLKKIMENIKKVTLVKNLWENQGLLANNENKKLYSKAPIKSLIDNKNFLDKSDEKQNKQLKGLILYNLNHKLVSGIKVQGSGRLTKRLTASRSITKYRSKGSLKNINSSRNGLSSVMVRGYFKSNLQYVNINSYNRNGSFGVKSWISSY